MQYNNSYKMQVFQHEFLYFLCFTDKIKRESERRNGGERLSPSHSTYVFLYVLDYYEIINLKTQRGQRVTSCRHRDWLAPRIKISYPRG